MYRREKTIVNSDPTFVNAFGVLLLGALVFGLAACGQMPDRDAIRPVSREETPWWAERHQKKLQEIRRGKVDIVFIGDSITHNYEFSSTSPQYDFLSVWNRYYGGRSAVNLGFNGDSTANVLWRLDHGEIDGLNAKVAMVLIGTNDTIQGKTMQQTAAGIDQVVATIQRRLPATKILLLGILPSAGAPSKQAADRAVNAYLADKYAASNFVTFIDVGHVFLKDSAVDASLFMDPRADPSAPALHPDAYAQARMAEAIEPILARLLGEPGRPGAN